MKKQNLVVLMAALGIIAGAALPQLSFATEYDVDAAHSSIGFEVKHLMISTVRGSFGHFEGAIDKNDEDLTHAQVHFTVSTESINTGNEKRDQHLRSPDFLDVKKFPEAKFVSTSIKKAGKKAGKDHYVLEGDLTLHGITKKAHFNMNYLGQVKDPWGVQRAAFQASTELNRKDFGLNWNKALETGGVVVGDQVKLIVELEATAKPKEAEKK